MSGLLSASLVFCAKYLPSTEVSAWFRSVVAVADKRWTAQVITWLVGAHAILTGEAGWPGALSPAEPFGATWSWSHALRGTLLGSPVSSSGPGAFLPSENRASILKIVSELDVEVFFESLLTDSALEAVAAETAGLSERFTVLYR